MNVEQNKTTKYMSGSRTRISRLQQLARKALLAGRYERAARLARAWCELDRGSTAARIHLAYALYRSNQHTEAKNIICAATRLPIKGYDNCMKLASLLLFYGYFQLAEQITLQVLAYEDRFEPVKLLGDIHAAMGNFDKAEKLYRQVMTMQVDNHPIKLALAMLAFQQKDLAEGFRGYESRKYLPEAESHSARFTFRDHPENLHPGVDIKDKRILIPMEQGVGDCIQWLRYIPLLSDAGATVIIYCGKRMGALAGICSGVERRVTKISEGEFDYICDIGSLPFYFGTTWETIPDSVPYLHPPQAMVDRLKQRYRHHFAGKPVIGISWTGGQGGLHRYRRSIPLPYWTPLLSCDEFAFVSLQYGEQFRRELDELPEALRSRIYDDREIDHVGDLVQAAAQVSACDFIVSVDNSTVHFAGAMGKPVWTLLPYVCDWRWSRTGKLSPWYPGMRLLRQEDPHDWTAVINEVVRTLPQALQQILSSTA